MNILAMSAAHLPKERLDAVLRVMVRERDTVGMSPYILNADQVAYMCESYGFIPSYLVDRLTYIAEQKIDGFGYCGEHGRFISTNRSTAKGSVGAIIDKTEHVNHMAQALMRAYEDTGCNLHGEVFKPGGTSDDVTAIMGCAADKAQLRQDETERLCYMLYDIREFKGKNITSEPFYVRRAILDYVYDKYFTHNPYIKRSTLLMDPVPAFNAIIAQHGEGLVIKDTHASYLPDKKPIGNWIKVKKQITLDAVVMDYDKEGSGKNAGLIKSVTVGLYINGKLTPIGQVNSGIDDALRVELTTRMEFYKGYVMEIEAMDYNFKHNTMRHARFIRFRDDKLYTKCVPEAIREHSMEPID